jgi:tetratricopeptide (TPR) repeat protein
MIRRRAFRAGLLSVAVAVLASCAEVPITPLAIPPKRVSAQDEEVGRAIAKHRELARQAAQAGDLAAAATQWQIVTALAPDDATYRRELADARAAVDRRARENLAAGNAAMKSGDADRAVEAMLRVLALEPDNKEAAQVLRDVEKRRLMRIQAGRAAKVNEAAAAAPSSAKAVPQRPATADVADAYSLEQPLEMFRAGDTAGGLRDLRRYVDQNPNDKAARNRIGAAVYDRAKDLEAQGQREQALAMYEQAVALRGDAAPGWTARIQAVKKALGDEYFDKGVKAWPADPPLAMKQWEASLKFDPQNAKAAARLKDARAAQDKGARTAK